MTAAGWPRYDWVRLTYPRGLVDGAYTDGHGWLLPDGRHQASQHDRNEFLVYSLAGLGLATLLAGGLGWAVSGRAPGTFAEADARSGAQTGDSLAVRRTAAAHCAMGVQVGFHGGSSRFRGRPAWLWSLSDSGPAAALDGRQHFCTSEGMRPVRLLEINIGTVAYRAMWGYGVDPPSDTFELPILSRDDVDFDSNKPPAWLVRQAQAELGVDLGLVGRVGVAEDCQHVGERAHD
jgi:hypothetical protein